MPKRYYDPDIADATESEIEVALGTLGHDIAVIHCEMDAVLRRTAEMAYNAGFKLIRARALNEALQRRRGCKPNWIDWLESKNISRKRAWRDMKLYQYFSEYPMSKVGGMSVLTAYEMCGAVSMSMDDTKQERERKRAALNLDREWRYMRAQHLRNLPTAKLLDAIAPEIASILGPLEDEQWCYTCTTLKEAAACGRDIATKLLPPMLTADNGFPVILILKVKAKDYDDF